jgi:hypothetical protein
VTVSVVTTGPHAGHLNSNVTLTGTLVTRMESPSAESFDSKPKMHDQPAFPAVILPGVEVAVPPASVPPHLPDKTISISRYSFEIV